MQEKWTAKRVEEILLIAQEAVSLNDVICTGDNGDDIELEDYIVDPSPTPEDLVLTEEKCDTIRAVMEKYLKPREREVIKMRFGFNGPCMTLEEIGDKLQITRERVRQIEARAKRKLMVLLRKRGVVEYNE